jgi:branched-chain amino acid transport system ATP-binding protein
MLRVDNLVAGYGRVRIVDGVSFEVPEGRIVALLGGNGTGKSTTLKAVAGLLAPSGGEIRFAGDRIDGVPAHRLAARGLVLVPQGKEVLAEMSVRENLLVGAYPHRRARRRVAEEFDRVLMMMPRLGERIRSPAGALSGGERQLLGIGRALMGSPRMMLMDEPSAALAPRAVAEITEVVRGLARSGITILLVEQNVGMALALAERLYVLRAGRIAHEAAAGSVTSYDALRRFYLGEPTKEEPTP